MNNDLGLTAQTPIQATCGESNTAPSVRRNRTVTLGAGQRVTVDPWNMAQLQNWAFSTEVIVNSATVAGNPPPGIVVERVQYWNGQVWPFYGASGSMGTP